MEHRGDLRARRNLVVGEQTSHAVTPFEDDDAPSGLREVRRGNQAVVPGADHDDVGGVRAHATFAFRPFLIERNTSSAAILPGAPMMPPPGCVAEPHSHRPSMGARYRAHPGTGRLKNSCSS